MRAEIINQDDWDCLSISKLASAFRVSRDTVSRKLSDNGVNSTGMRGGYPVYKLGDAARAILVPQKKEVDNSNPDKMAPKERRDWFASENDRIKLEKEQGLVVPVENIRREWSSILQRIGSALDAIPDKLERKARLSAESLDLVEREIDAIRNDLATSLE